MLVFRTTRLDRVARMIGVGWLFASLALPVAAIPSTPSLAPAGLQQALNAAWQEHPSARVTEATLAAARARAEAAGRPLYNPALELSADRWGCGAHHGGRHRVDGSPGTRREG